MKFKLLILTFLSCYSCFSLAGNQQYEKMKQETITVMRKSVSDTEPKINSFISKEEENKWLILVGEKIKKYIQEDKYRIELLRSIHYEAVRAGLDPYLVLAIVDVESKFNKYSVSNQGARGLMQVMPFWVDIIGENSHNVFNIRTNLRYGCTIMKHYLDRENGDVVKALARYNGSLGKDTYPLKVLRSKEKLSGV